MRRSQAAQQLAEAADGYKTGEWDEWLASRPPIIREMAARTPPGVFYRMKAGAPYVYSHPGAIVWIYSYGEDGDVGVIIVASDLLDEPSRVHVDPKWMEPISFDEAFPVDTAMVN